MFSSKVLFSSDGKPREAARDCLCGGDLWDFSGLPREVFHSWHGDVCSITYGFLEQFLPVVKGISLKNIFFLYFKLNY